MTETHQQPKVRKPTSMATLIAYAMFLLGFVFMGFGLYNYRPELQGTEVVTIFDVCVCMFILLHMFGLICLCINDAINTIVKHITSSHESDSSESKS